MAGVNPILPPVTADSVQYDPFVVNQKIDTLQAEVSAIEPVTSTAAADPVAYWNVPDAPAGKFIPAAWANLTATNTAIVNNTGNRGNLYWIPFVFPTANTVDAVVFNCTVANANTKVRVGLYTDRDGRPDTLLIDAGQTAITTTGLKTVTLATAQAIPAGKRIWGAVVLQDSVTTTAAITGITCNFAPWKYQDNAGSAIGAGNASNPAFYTGTGVVLSSLPATTSNGSIFYVDTTGTGLSVSPNMTLRLA